MIALDTLAEAEDIVLFYDDDESGLEAMSGMVMKLGQHRCRIARIPDEISQRVEEATGNAPKDANDLLRTDGREDLLDRVMNGQKDWPIEGLFKLSDIPEVLRP